MRVRRFAVAGWMAVGVVLAGPLARAAAVAEDVVIYECPRAPRPPTIDGKLDDAAWRGVPETALPYKFMAQTPVPAESRSTFRLCYDARALYLACTFFRDSDAPLKQNHRGRDDPDLWKDDSTELYFDPANTGRFFKLIVSCAGVVTDFRMTAKGMDYAWNADGARVATQVAADRWTLELSLPWADLGLATPEREIWGFEVLRFSGKHWASWTVGASYARPEKFGFITFGQGFFAELERVLAVAGRSKGSRWRLVSRLGVVDYTSKPVALDGAVADAARRLGEARLNARNVADATRRAKLDGRIAALQKQLDARAAACGEPERLAEQDFKAALHELGQIATQAADLSCEALIQEMLSDAD